MLLHHLGEIDSTAETAILTGDPERVPLLAEHVGTATSTSRRRGYVCTETLTDGGPLLVCSTGIGGPTTAIVVEELSLLGVSRFVRVGTCGSMQKHINAGHAVISTGCVRDEGTSHQYLPAEYPTVPSFALVRALVESAEQAGLLHHVGITHCKDAYYAEKPDGYPLADQWRARWNDLRLFGVLATEMEAATLFAVAGVRACQSAAVFIAVDDTLSPDRTMACLLEATRVAARAASAVAAASR